MQSCHDEPYGTKCRLALSNKLCRRDLRSLFTCTKSHHFSCLESNCFNFRKAQQPKMPRAKKYVTKLQPLTGDDLDDQLSRTVIIHPGSRYVRMARPLDREAVVMCHCIARKQTNPSKNGETNSKTSNFDIPESFRNIETHSSTKEFKQAFNTAETWLKENSNEEKTVGRMYCSFDAKESEEQIPVTKNFVVGNNALDVAALNSNYFLTWPLRFGRFNLHKGPGGSRHALMADIENIWDEILAEELKIPKKKRENFRVILILPDVFDRKDVVSFVEILLIGLEFHAVFVVLENVASLFGASSNFGCVLDVGAEKTIISCVEDGISLPETRILLHYGGDDITRLTNWFLQQKLRAFNLNLNSMTDWFKMDAIKKSLCHFDFSQSGSNEIFVNLPSPDREESVKIKIPHDFCRLPNLTLFVNGLIAPPPGGEQQPSVEFFTPYEGCGEDIYGTGVRNANRKVGVQKKVEKTTDTASFLPDSHENSFLETPNFEKNDFSQFENQNKLMELHRAVFWSISKCSSEEQQKKMLRNILVVGGGYALFPGALEFLKKKLEEIVSPNFEISVLVNSREIPSDLSAWKGASIMAALETVQYLWITKEEWVRNGVKVLREKSSFGW